MYRPVLGSTAQHQPLLNPVGPQLAERRLLHSWPRRLSAMLGILQAVAIEFGFMQPVVAGGHALGCRGPAGLDEAELGHSLLVAVGCPLRTMPIMCTCAMRGRSRPCRARALGARWGYHTLLHLGWRVPVRQLAASVPEIQAAADRH